MSLKLAFVGAWVQYCGLLRCFWSGCNVGGAICVPCRLKACSTRFPILLERAGGADGRVFFGTKLFFPLLFFLCMCGLESGGLAAMEIHGCPLEKGNVLRYQDVLDRGACICQSLGLAWTHARGEDERTRRLILCLQEQLIHDMSKSSRPCAHFAGFACNLPQGTTCKP